MLKDTMKDDADIVCTPYNYYNNKTVSADNGAGFAYYETIGDRPSQEDALAYLGNLDAESNLAALTPEQVGARMWSVHLQLDAEYNGKRFAGTTASSNFYDGKGNIITATLADAASFAVVYNKDGEVLKVVRLNSVTHKPDDKQEKSRILELNGQVKEIDGIPRVNGILAVCRAIGDKSSHFQGKKGDYLISSESQVDINSIKELTSDLDLNLVGQIEVITTCDGFTDGAGFIKQTKEAHETYLKNCLTSGDAKGLHGKAMCNALADQAIKDGSRDNISVAAQVIFAEGKPLDKPVFLGVYDGHGGIDASTFVASHIGRVFRAQCALTEVQYAKNEYSIYQPKHKEAFNRDHTESARYLLANTIKELKSDVDNLLLQIRFDIFFEQFKDLEVTVYKSTEATEELSNFIKNIALEKKNLLDNPSTSNRFIKNCKELVIEAQSGPLKDYRDVNRVLKAFIEAINWLASFIFKEPLIKTRTYRELGLFRQHIEELPKSVEKSKPRPE